MKEEPISGLLQGALMLMLVRRKCTNIHSGTTGRYCSVAQCLLPVKAKRANTEGMKPEKSLKNRTSVSLDWL